MAEFPVMVQVCALIALVAVIFLIGAVARKRPDAALIAILVIFIAIAVASAFGFESPAHLPLPPIG